MKTKLILLFQLSVLLLTITQHANSQWTQQSGGLNADRTIRAFDSLGTNLLAATNDNGVYISTNNGSAWTQSGLVGLQVNALIAKDNTILAGVQDYPPGAGGVYVSTNNGTSWVRVGSNYTVLSLAILGNNILAGTHLDGLLRSTNNGANFSSISIGSNTINALKVAGSNIFAGVNDSGVYVSTNNGANWTSTTLNNKTVLSLTVSGTNIFAGTYDSGVYFSSNNGATWTQTSLGGNYYILSMASRGNNIFAGTYGFGIFHSSNNGTTWTQKNEGFFSAYSIYDIAIKFNYVYAGTISGSVWRRVYSNMIAGVQQTSSITPAAFLLNQNYPNPFNPETKINFSIPKTSNTVLKVFNTNGTEVQTLVNQNLQAGTYSVEFGNTNLTSGIYFYTLTSGEFKETKKMILVK